MLGEPANIGSCTDQRDELRFDVKSTNGNYAEIISSFISLCETPTPGAQRCPGATSIQNEDMPSGHRLLSQRMSERGKFDG